MINVAGKWSIAKMECLQEMDSLGLVVGIARKHWLAPVRSTRALGVNLHDAAHASHMDFPGKIPGGARSLHDCRQAAPALEIHVSHRPDLALPNQAEHFTHPVRGRASQSCDGK